MDVFDKNSQFLKEGDSRHESQSVLKNSDDLSLIYAPGLTHSCKEISAIPEKIFDLNIRKNTVAIVTDGSDISGLGNIGAQAALVVVERKALLVREQVDIDAFPMCLTSQKNDDIVNVLKEVAPIFSGLHIGEVESSRSFAIVRSLQGIGVPIVHDEQHGFSIFILAALINAATLAGKLLSDLKVVIYGYNDVAVLVAELLLLTGQNQNMYCPVNELILCDKQGIISKAREDISHSGIKKYIAGITNKNNLQGTLKDALFGADVFIDITGAQKISKDMFSVMRSKPIVFAMCLAQADAILQAARQAGVFIVGTSKGTYPDNVYDALIFPGLVRGMIDAQAVGLNRKMTTAAAYALAEGVDKLSVDNILPDTFDRRFAFKIAESVQKAYVPVEPIN